MWSHELHGFAGMRQRMMEKGHFKYIMLDTLKDKPAHGYELIRSLEERFKGFYSPSPGVVYPTLQLLEDLGYVRSNRKDGRKVYEITDEGRTFLEENRETVESIHNRMQGWSRAENWEEEIAPLILEVRDLIFLLHRGRKAGRTGSDRIKRIREVLEKTRKEIASILAE